MECYKGHNVSHPISVRDFVLYEWFYQVGKCVLSFGAESFVFQVAIQKFKDQDIYIEL